MYKKETHENQRSFCNTEYSKMNELRVNEHMTDAWMNGEFMYECMFEYT